MVSLMVTSLGLDRAALHARIQCNQWCIAKNGGGYTQRGVAKGLKVPCLFMITEVSIRYDTRCYFNVRSKADISQLNLPHGTDN